MKQVIGLVLLGLLCSNGVLAENGSNTQAEAPSQSGRIINGAEVNIAGYKFAISLFVDNRYYCGASIITASHALTAAHCVLGIAPSRVILYGGSSFLNRPVVRITVSRIAVHPSYNPSVSKNYDAAVITVPTNSFVGKPNMAPIGLQTAQVPTGTRCYVVGWGWYDNNLQTASNSLRYTNVQTVSDASCSATFQQTIMPDQICSINGNNIEVCKGDSGSALVCGGTVTGVVSFGRVPCTNAAPTVYAKVMGPSVRSFIRSQAGI
ncbi:trypsin delta-like [Anopheles maculipalpis]|uniref:trypsin delta-like n=1 Tax=Anopheles maculipalpis TaxID=1496333 RepID=UPI0021594932|nr:trypsin delta-like [Anopheles maculipalpis]